MNVSWLNRDLAIRCLGVLLLLACWEISGRLGLLGRAWPPLSGVLEFSLNAGTQKVLLQALNHTLGAAIGGFVLGTLAGVALACIALLAPPLQRGLDHLASMVNAIPLIALGPVLIVTVGRGATPVAIATLTVFFGMFIAASAGLAEARRDQRDLLRVLGARRLQTLLLLQLPIALPRIIDGLKLSASAAVVGAILGEWFGAGGGIGLLLVSAMQNFQINLLWAAALLGVLVSLLAFALLGLLQRWVEYRFL